jgi:N-hydroxyarylamine O-acetyltransferase
MDINAYLQRIKYNNHVKRDAKSLYDLHRAHMLAVPFENLDIGQRHPIRITERDIFEKIVNNNRGGFCYELNGLFAWLLKEIGFNVTYLNARVFDQQGNLGIDFGHLTLLAQIPGQTERWLADVGFGDSFTEPLRFDMRDEQGQGLRAYRLEKIPAGYVMWQKNYHEKWERQYFFDLQPHNFPKEYKAGCHYHQTSPKSSFTRGSIISKATPDGRVSLEEGRLILTKNGQRTEQPVSNEAEYRRLLKKYFELEL